jgi:hypothetical protein
MIYLEARGRYFEDFSIKELRAGKKGNLNKWRILPSDAIKL